jgi:hypothetical protein
MADTLTKLGDKVKDYWGKIKSLPPDEGEAQAIKEKQANVDAVTAKPTPEPEHTGSEPMPQGNYGSRPGEKRLDWAMKPEAPVYDNGGDVAMSGFKKMAPSLDEEDPHLKEEQIPQYTHGNDPARAKPQPKDFNGGSVGGVQDTALATPMYAPGQAPAMAAPIMDNGGDVKNINDGQHQVAILQTGERVLDRDEAARYRQMHGSKMPTMHESMDVNTGKPSSSLPELTPAIKPTPTAPLYDQGGIVGGSNLRKLGAPVYDNGGEVKTQPSYEERIAPYQLPRGYEDAKPVHDTLQLPRGYEDAQPVSRYGEAQAVANRPRIGMPKISMEEDHSTEKRSTLPVYDDGGSVDVNDGQHQAAILKDGERVLTPEENAQYKAEHPEKGAPADFGGRVIPNPKGIKPMDSDAPHAPTPMTYPGGAKMNIDNAPLDDKESEKTFPTVMPTEASAKSPARPYAEVEAEQKKAAEAKVNGDQGAQVAPAPTQESVPEQLPTATHEERVAIKHDEQEAMGKGIQGLTQLGMSKIHAKQLGINEEPSTEGVTAPKEFARPEQGGFPKMGEATPEAAAPAAPAAGAPAAPTTTSERSPDFKAKLAQLNQDHANALAERTPEGKVRADYIQEQINDLHKNNPWGTAGNRPGALGRLGHIASKFGNLAGDVFAPATMELIPGTDLNKRVQEAGLQKQTQADVQEATAREAEENKAGKVAPQDTYKEATQGGITDPAHPELGPQQAYVDEKDPSKIHFAGPMPPKAGAEKDQPANVDQQKDYQQRIANSGLTGQALQTYGTVPKGATTAELDKRFDEATKLRGMNQKDQETAIQNQARKDAADEKQFEHEQARADKLENQHFSYVDEKGQTQITTGDKVKELPEGTQTIPIKDVANLVGEARSMNAVQENMNVLHKDIEEHPEVFDNAAARTIVQTTTKEMNRASIGLLVAGTGMNLPIPEGFNNMIDTALQNNALDAKTAKSVKNYIADYKALKDKAMVIQMMMQNGKMGRGGMQAFDSIVNQLPGGSTPDSATAARQMGALQNTVKGLMGKYPEKYADYTKAKPYEAKEQGAAPKQGDKHQYAGANYTFDGKQWVQQK